MEIRPDYYDDFACIAGACRHNCCIGWEIDIDDESLDKYANTEGALRGKLRDGIALEPCAHFVLSAEERCPFLNGDNLCELILQGGDAMLCQICRDHPRFYNDVYGITEKGVGLCCEAAAKLVLTKTAPVRLVSDDGTFPQNAFYRERDALLAVLQNRRMSLDERMERVLERVGVSSPIEKADWVSVYKALERLDRAWEERLNGVDCLCKDIPPQLETACEQLLCYFLYRHSGGASEEFLFRECVQFAVLSCRVIVTLCRSCSVEELVEVARMYSSEIEYSDENVDILFEKLWECNR